VGILDHANLRRDFGTRRSNGNSLRQPYQPVVAIWRLEDYFLCLSPRNVGIRRDLALDIAVSVDVTGDGRQRDDFSLVRVDPTDSRSGSRLSRMGEWPAIGTGGHLPLVGTQFSIVETDCPRILDLRPFDL